MSRRTQLPTSLGKARLKSFLGLVLIASLLLSGSMAFARAPDPSFQATQAPSVQELVEQVEQATAGQARISYHAQTGKVRFIGTDLEHPIAAPEGLRAGASPEEAARQFLRQYGALFGLSDQAQELQMTRLRTRDRQRSFVRFQQVYQGVPIVAGELIVQTDAGRNVVSASGEILPDLAIDTTPAFDAAEAQSRAMQLVAKHYNIDPGQVTATPPELWIYNPVLLKPGLDLNLLVWRMDVQVTGLEPVRELVLIDAHTGIAALHFNQIDTLKNRIIYDNNNDKGAGLPGHGPVGTEGIPPVTGTDAVKAYDYAGDTYDFYLNNHGRDSIDDAGLTLVSTVRYCTSYVSEPCPYPNAFWNGEQMVYGESYAGGDDVVGHELTHGVTGSESRLFYYMQSGAINESLSDIWGEFVDLTNGDGNDAPAVRWLMGEDIPGGAIRSMSNPPAYVDPDRMTSSLYVCGEADNGGVHSNSGVGNKAAYLMVDGGSFNGQTVTGLGIPKTAKIWYEAQSNLLTSGSDYQDLYDNLQQACANLIGTAGITPADCQEVLDAVNATEMNLQPPSCPAAEAPLCPSGSPADLWYDDLENLPPLSYVYLPLVTRSVGPPPTGWITVLTEGFEGAFPGPWEVFDGNGSEGGYYYWSQRNCRSRTGNYSAWAVGGGQTTLSCGSNYPDSAESVLAYGPFSLAGATAADLSFDLWAWTESGYDGICWFASRDGVHFDGNCGSGYSSGWLHFALNLQNFPNVGNLLGDPSVWIAFVFISDSSVTRPEGVYLDNIVLRKYVAADPPPFQDSSTVLNSISWKPGALTGPGGWYWPQTWNPYGFDATYATSGQYNLWGYDQGTIADYYMAMTGDVSIPAVGTPYLHFNHAFAFEDYVTTAYDGGVLEYSVNGGASWHDAGALPMVNGYNGTIHTGAGNPLGGRSAFVYESNGYGSTRVDLSSLGGQSVRFRFRIGTDEAADALGWFIDDVRIYTCEPTRRSDEATFELRPASFTLEP